MKKILISLSLLFFGLTTFTACSKTPQDPYFDRAKTASEKAQEQLSRD